MIGLLAILALAFLIFAAVIPAMSVPFVWTALGLISGALVVAPMYIWTFRYKIADDWRKVFTFKTVLKAKKARKKYVNKEAKSAKRRSKYSNKSLDNKLAQA